MANIKPAYDQSYDLSNCDAEPLRYIRYTQPCALVLAVNRDHFFLEYASENLLGLFDLDAANFSSIKLENMLSDQTISLIKQQLALPASKRNNPIHVTEWRDRHNDSWQNLLLHETKDHVILEFEARSSEFSQTAFLQSIDQGILKLQRLNDSDDIFCATAEVIKELTGYSRVMIYRFDEHYNGEVIAEECERHHDSYLNLRYPHTDIPRQARDLYLRNGIRQIATTKSSEQVYLHRAPEAKELDLTPVDSRGVSTFHLEYLNNMNVGASLSAAIVLNGKLWGLIACHHDEEKTTDIRMRSMISFFCRMVSSHLMLQETHRFRSQILQSQLMRSELFEAMSKDYDVLGGLGERRETLLEMMSSVGCLLYFDQTERTIGQVPESKERTALIAFLNERTENLYHTDELLVVYPAAADWEHALYGILAIRLSHSPGEYIVWFRPEVAKTVTWGGKPSERKVMVDNQVRLNPQLSFAKWEEQVKGKSESWEQHQLDAAFALRNDIKEIIIQKYQQIRNLNQELTTAYEDLETFSYTVSHDLRAPLRTIKGFAEILEEDYHEQLDDYGRMVVNTITSSVGKMNQFINDMLSFSRLGRATMNVVSVDLRQIIEEAWTQTEQKQDQVSFVLPDVMPSVPGDPTLIRQVFVNLLSNAVKYSKKDSDRSKIEIRSRRENDRVIVEVIDNGIGFTMKYAERIFEVFHRLVNADEYEGTGVGLAIVKRIMDNHEGEVKASSVLGEGTTFTMIFKTVLDLEQE